MALQHAQRKMRIAHYGRSKSAKFDKVVPLLDSFTSNKISAEEKRVFWRHVHLDMGLN